MNSYALRNISYGLYIIGAMDKDRPSGCTANSAMQITSEPATLALSLNHDNYTNSLIKETGRFAISVLSETSDPGLIGGFGFRSGRSANKFDGVKYSMKEGVPVVDDSCAYIVCRVINSMETSTHTVFLGEVIDAELSDGVPMTYAYYHKVIKGKSPKNAPTYIPEPAAEEKKEEKAVEKKWECSVCGYEYDGDIPFGELPEDYVCPVCGQPKSVFEAK